MLIMPIFVQSSLETCCSA